MFLASVLQHINPLCTTQMTYGSRFLCSFPGTDRVVQDIGAGPPLESIAQVATHIIYEGAEVLANGQIKMTNPNYASDGNNGTVKGRFAELFLLKVKHENIKVLLSIADDMENVTAVLKSEASRIVFASSAANLTQRYGFDGVRLSLVDVRLLICRRH
jgi:Glycosyl hydrolases family 18